MRKKSNVELMLWIIVLIEEPVVIVEGADDKVAVNVVVELELAVLWVLDKVEADAVVLLLVAWVVLVVKVVLVEVELVEDDVLVELVEVVAVVLVLVVDDVVVEVVVVLVLVLVVDEVEFVPIFHNCNISESVIERL